VVRRLKSKVLTGLPEKTFDPRWCDLLPAQRELYDELVRTKVNPLRDDLEAGRSVSTLHVFALLDQLKRLCDHPDLLLDPGQPASGVGSGKWELFAEILDEVLASGLEIVVFSQYLGMLDLMAAHCERLGVGFASLRGSTVDREAPVARFRDDPNCRVFLASLKAGGVGIDLTRASVVLHYDRWWNRAREDQATDRVHRIGQQRGVQVITLSTRNTVEERIEEIVAHKAELAAGLLPDDEAGLVGRFSREDLRRVLG
jgi:SNF2 family DNA or RNA helicase